MQTGTSLIYRIFTFTIFIIILIFIAGSLNLSAKLDYNTFKPYKPNAMLPSQRPSPSEASSSDMPDSPETKVPETEPAETEPPETEPAETDPPAETEPAETDPPAETEPAETRPPAETEPAETRPPAETEPVVNPDSEIWKYAFAGQLPVSSKVDDTYFKNALFIGDSRTVGFCNFTAIAKYCYARVSLNIKSVLTTEFIEDSSSGTTITRTVLETVKAYPKSFGKIYISFGVNEYSWAGTTFIACYEYFINSLRDVLPEGVPIYVQSVLPVDENVSVKNGYHVNNNQLDDFNGLLADMAERLDVYFVNTAEAVTAEDSFSLPSGYASDGVHLNKSTCLKIQDYLLTHTANQVSDNK
ncbi:MAG: GDSL-type esterase/lipase family protein [Eubacteriales bacterium]